MIGRRSEGVSFRRSKRQGLAMSVTERYARDDVPCALQGCGRCGQNAELGRRGVPLLDGAKAHVLVPDASVVSRYIELLEQCAALTNMVFCQTVVDALDRRGRTRTIRNVRKIAADHTRRSVVFANEIFSATQASGSAAGLTPAERDMRAVLRAAAWYRRHLDALGGRATVIILTLKDYPAACDGVEVRRLADFIAEFHPTLLEYFRSAESATADGDMDITAKSPAQHAQARLQAKAQGAYSTYYSTADIDEGLRSGALVRGTIRLLPVGSTRPEPQGVIERGGDGSSIVVTGRAALNRVCTGDVVVVKVLAGAGASAETGKACGAKDDEDGDDDEGVEEELAVEQIDAGEETPLVTAAQPLRGVVVGVAERKWRPYVATLQVDAGGGARHLAVPVDASVPKIRIHYMDVAAIEDRYFVVAIDGWPADSQYPQGHFVRALGPIGTLDAEIDTILVERQIAVSQSALGFSEACLREMPIDSPQQPWAPHAEEIARRRDMRSALIFSIDPKGSQDIDDSVSMRRTKGGYELGVHIADVTQFVSPGSAADSEALARGTTVYLADRRFNMIPEVLSERVCSLRGGKDRYAVSVVWDLDPQYGVRAVWFGRTVIRSACEMYYEQAQALLDGKSGVEGLDPAMEESLRASVVELAQAMRALRERRREAGALELASTEVKFAFDPSTHAVAEMAPKAGLEIHRVIEEAMVFANAAVARRIHQTFPSAALLRRHRSPAPERFERLVQAVRAKGFEIDCSSNAALATSLQAIARATASRDPETVFLAKSMATLAMQEAEYFATGDCASEGEFAHYGLAEGFYTHFTSPIRRYADVIVHRQLLAALERDGGAGGEPAAMEARQWVGAAAAQLNRRNRQSKLAQRESTELFQSRYVSQRTLGAAEHLVADGVVAEVRTNGLIVYVPRFGIRGPVHLRDKSGHIKLPLSALSGNARDIDSHVDGCTDFDVGASQLSIRLPVNVPVFQLGSPVLAFAVFDRVKVALRVLETRRRRPPVYLTLVSRGKASVKDVKAYRSTLAPLDRQLRLSAASARVTEQQKQHHGRAGGGVVAAQQGGVATDPGTSAGSSGGGKKSKKQAVDFYAVLEKFGELSLLETRCGPQTL